jgi:hypothetical protein
MKRVIEPLIEEVDILVIVVTKRSNHVIKLLKHYFEKNKLTGLDRGTGTGPDWIDL